MVEANRKLSMSIRKGSNESVKLKLNHTYQTRKKVIDFAKLGEKLSLSGSNCHFCKSVMTVNESNACRFVYIKANEANIKSVKRKACNKKFCFSCLEKNFPTFYANRFSKNWQCPCCSGECFCLHCKKLNLKEIGQDRLYDNDSLQFKDTCSWDNENRHDMKLMGRDPACINPLLLLKQIPSTTDIKVSLI